MIVEVKGTTSIGEKIVMTRNEVAAHRSHHPHNALIIVHSIDLQRLLPENPKADGGILLMLSPWEIVESQLRPLAFEYTFEPSSPT